jgi:hypothetical protein
MLTGCERVFACRALMSPGLHTRMHFSAFFTIQPACVEKLKMVMGIRPVPARRAPIKPIEKLLQRRRHIDRDFY